MEQDFEKIAANTTVGVQIMEKSKSIFARITISIGNPAIITIKGYTVHVKNGEKYVAPPSYINKKDGMSSMIWMPPKLWELISNKILKEVENYCR